MTSNRKVDQEVGSRLREKRLINRISVNEFAAKLGVSPEQLDRFERGDERIPAVELRDACILLDTNIMFFFDSLVGHERASAQRVR